METIFKTLFAFFFLDFAFFFRTTYGSSQARGPMGAAAASLHHSNAIAMHTIAMPDLSHVCDLCHSSWQCWILNPLSKARDWTCNLMAPSRIHFRCATMGTPVTYNSEWDASSVKDTFETIDKTWIGSEN